MMVDRVAAAAISLNLSFNKGSVAKTIVEELRRLSDASTLPTRTVDSVTSLFRTINLEFERLGLSERNKASGPVQSHP
jgi:hypothetical protein